MVKNFIEQVTKKRRSKGSSTDSTISTTGLEQIIERLRTQRNRASKRKNYYGIWKSFNEFYIKLDVKPDSWEDRITLFVGFLIQGKRKSTTIRSYVSAIKAVLMEDGISLNEDTYLLSSLTKACKLENDKVRLRLPIRRPMLHMLLESLHQSYYIEKEQPYLCLLYQTLFSTAFYGLFRIGEVTCGSHPIKARDVHIGSNKDKMLFVLRTSKTHWNDVRRQTVKISSAKKIGKKTNIWCPFKLLRDYVNNRETYKCVDEPFFIFKGNMPVSPNNARKVLKETLELSQFNSNYYDFHSFRAGMASEMYFKYHLPLERIKKLGRWRSNIVYSYLKQ